MDGWTDELPPGWTYGLSGWGQKDSLVDLSINQVGNWLVGSLLAHLFY